MKKFLALALALLLVMGMTGAWAATYNNKDGQDLTDYLDSNSLKFVKEYKIEGGTSPAVTFQFSNPKLVKYSYPGATDIEDEDALEELTSPSVTLGNAAYTQDSDLSEGTHDKDVSVTVAINGADLGVYTYEVTEQNPGKTGVTYREDPFYIVVTVLRDEDDGKHYVGAVHVANSTSGGKEDKVQNTYGAGKLTVSKKVTGNMADQSKYFKFDVQLTATAGTLDTSAITVSLGGVAMSDISEDASKDVTKGEGYTLSGGQYTFYLKHGQSAVIDNIPNGVTYTVTEDADGYIKTKAEYTDTATTKKIETRDDDKVDFENELKSTIDTGITLDTLPYVVLLAAVAVGLVLMIARRRKQED